MEKNSEMSPIITFFQLDGKEMPPQVPDNILLIAIR
jgi:hypothetical protein